MHMHARMDGFMDGWIDERTDGRTDGWMDGRTDGGTTHVLCMCVYVWSIST